MDRTSCYGCQNNCPDQLSHMDIGGCLYTDPQTVNISEKESNPQENYCVECGVSLGDNNPRQLCGKSRCYNDKDHDEEEEIEYERDCENYHKLNEKYMVYLKDEGLSNTKASCGEFLSWAMIEDPQRRTFVCETLWKYNDSKQKTTNQ